MRRLAFRSRWTHACRSPRPALASPCSARCGSAGWAASGPSSSPTCEARSRASPGAGSTSPRAGCAAAACSATTRRAPPCRSSWARRSAPPSTGSSPSPIRWPVRRSSPGRWCAPQTRWARGSCPRTGAWRYAGAARCCARWTRSARWGWTTSSAARSSISSRASPCGSATTPSPAAWRSSACAAPAPAASRPPSCLASRRGACPAPATTGACWAPRPPARSASSAPIPQRSTATSSRPLAPGRGSACTWCGRPPARTGNRCSPRRFSPRSSACSTPRPPRAGETSPTARGRSRRRPTTETVSAPLPATCATRPTGPSRWPARSAGSGSSGVPRARSSARRRFATPRCWRASRPPSGSR